MNPALSVVFFTTLAGAGQGLLLALVAAHWAAREGWIAAAMDPGFAALGALVAAALAAAGLVASFFHLGRPERAWRAAMQWRTSWLSREGVLAVASFAPAVVLLLLLSGDGGTELAATTRIAAALLALLGLATVACTAMIYASLKPIPAWRHRLVLPGYVLFALLTGGLPMLLSVVPGSDGFDRWLPCVLAAIAIALLALKLAYWRDIDRSPLPQTRGHALGLPRRMPSVFERPHTEANYITREMAFAVARRHARALRIASVLLFALVPLACLLLAWSQPGTGWTLPLATGCALAGAFLERWLFFAQARHLVTLYY